ncbi:histone-like nucleoid-structuring protein Lsr2 [Microbacterium sp. HJ5]
MARRIVHQLVDDLDGTILEVGEGETVLFSLDGVAYEIDLTEGNASALRDALAPYVAAGRSVGSSRGGSRGTGGSSSAGGSANRKRRRSGQQDYSAVRAWAKENGHQVSERGRVPASVLDAYEAAH